MNLMNYFKFLCFLIIHDVVFANIVPGWKVNKFIRCHFCTNYNTHDNSLSFQGCLFSKATSSCYGNICFMRKHKRPNYNLFSAGCLNTTIPNMRKLKQISDCAENFDNFDENKINNYDTNANNGVSNEANHINKNYELLCNTDRNTTTCLCATKQCNHGLLTKTKFVDTEKEIFVNFDFNEPAFIRNIFLEYIKSRMSEKLMTDSSMTQLDFNTIETHIQNKQLSHFIAGKPWKNNESKANQFNMLEYSDINLSDIILFVIYIGICIVGLIGNFSVLYILSFEKSVNANNDRNNTSKSTKTFIANLAIADILFLICCIPATALNMSHLFPDSKLYCTTQFYMAYICSAVSSWTFCSLAINRFVAVVHPHWSLKVKDNNFIFIGGCALIWILSFGILVWYILPTPQLVYATADWHNGSETILSVYCLESLEIHNKSANETAVMLFYMGYSIFSFILPLTGTSFFYFAVFSHLKKVANNVQRSAITPEHQSRINKIILKVVFTFTACWLPLNIKYLIQGYSYPSKLFPEESFDKSLMIVNTIIQLMAYSNACMNPILYCFMLPKCRERLNNIISQFCCYIFTFFGLFNYSKNTSIPAAYKLTAIEYERYNALASTSETNVRGTYV